MGKSRALDALDRKILHEVQINNQLTSAQLSEKVGLSPTSAQRRLNRLRGDKVIEGDVSVVSTAAVGRSLTMIISVQLERERSDIIDHFKKAVRNEPVVMSAYYVTGDTDFMLIISARDMEEYEEFTRHFLYDNPDIKGFKTTVVMDRIKASFYTPPWE
ncbi:Lrp/AsnC family transcriptional regulator [Parasedimentitalea maritima]|uniref:AsnC family transcriptional regulator n=1 Tax=Parasedimentitalea maritima TaxID=2578117 RepID=A0A5R8ZA31_9RHOB|nr:Lrp/AsnC family transcriptional regulator [Zongyanglinia marina]KAE9626414.1 AsnC family transcriptional regulator [Zongyanglinia marina]TLP62580.1 Lrp/AsnC family transcriptional regulator [Zongyanglinia marina]